MAAMNSLFKISAQDGQFAFGDFSFPIHNATSFWIYQGSERSIVRIRFSLEDERSGTVDLVTETAEKMRIVTKELFENTNLKVELSSFEAIIPTDEAITFKFYVDQDAQQFMDYVLPHIIAKMDDLDIKKEGCCVTVSFHEPGHKKGEAVLKLLSERTEGFRVEQLLEETRFRIPFSSPKGEREARIIHCSDLSIQGFEITGSSVLRHVFRLPSSAGPSRLDVPTDIEEIRSWVQ